MKILPKKIVEENFKGIKKLINDEVLFEWYKSIIVICMEEYSREACEEQRRICAEMVRKNTDDFVEMLSAKLPEGL